MRLNTGKFQINASEKSNFKQYKKYNFEGAT